MNFALGAILLIATAAFGVGYAAVERHTLLAIERRHLEHLLALAALLLRDVRDLDELEGAVRALERSLSEARGTTHELVVWDERGETLAVAHANAPGGLAQGSPRGVVPKALRAAVPFRARSWAADAAARAPNRIELYESLEDLDPLLRRSLSRHLLFAGGVVALIVVAAGIVLNRVVVGPVRELAGLTEEIGSRGQWAPVAPSTRRRDEIGLLGDRIAQMSRELAEAVRVERYGSASLVAHRVRHELDEPLRRIAMHLSVLGTILPSSSDAGRARDEIVTELARVTATLRSLAIHAGERPPGPSVRDR